ncbi:hypothetical protein H0H81_001483 [Sphagnurus paluster]|uniref:Uncharacterized protein n=1 Tax=Sphagnurus paluster TaxID=117069 RepID=A0A9P7KJR2_9AGAR|nr:hypothetical protein H0H81_001483 [Sphagnurus paluster]
MDSSLMGNLIAMDSSLPAESQSPTPDPKQARVEEHSSVQIGARAKPAASKPAATKKPTAAKKRTPAKPKDTNKITITKPAVELALAKMHQLSFSLLEVKREIEHIALARERENNRGLEIRNKDMHISLRVLELMQSLVVPAQDATSQYLGTPTASVAPDVQPARDENPAAQEAILAQEAFTTQLC